MSNRSKKILVGACAVMALGVGGIALAQGATTGVGSTAATATAQGNDHSGNETGSTADTQTGADTGSASDNETSSESQDARDTDTVQSGDQTGPDTSQGAETADSSSGESTESEVPGDDGPGGHADEPGSPNAGHEFDGQE